MFGLQRNAPRTGVVYDAEAAPERMAPATWTGRWPRAGYRQIQSSADRQAAASRKPVGGVGKGRRKEGR